MLVVNDKAVVVCGPKSWIEGEATRQLEHVSKLPNMVEVIGMPDLHPGQGCPVGAVFVANEHIYPHLIGSDIGCGMGWWTTSIKPGKADKFSKKLKGLEDGVEDPLSYIETDPDAEPTGYEHSLGTIGQGNHFAELLVWDEILDENRVFEITGGAKTMLLVHSGSRGYGERILFDHTAVYRDQGFVPNDMKGKIDYIAQHDRAVRWARLNRKIIAQRIFDCLGAVGHPILDIEHNFVELGHYETGSYWIHRKGAIPSNRGPVVIPGSRGSHSYLVEPIGDHSKTGFSLSHGAGRKMSRRDARVKFEKGHQSLEKATKTRFNSVVICEDRQTLIEEVPEAYKAIDRVIQDLVDHGLIRVLALMKPILTYKVRR